MQDPREQFAPDTLPLKRLQEWIHWAAAETSLKDPQAANVSTVDQQGHPHSRQVLIKKIEEDAVVFYTSYNSPKSAHLAHSPFVSVNFFWDALRKQVRLEGESIRTSRQESVDYWQTRGRESQISQYISNQSKEFTSRKDLEKAWMKAQKEWEGKMIPCPEHWGGFRIRVKTIEFWMAHPHRLHYRFVYSKKGSSAWSLRRLLP